MGGRQHLSNSSLRKKGKQKINSSRKKEMAFSQCETEISFKLLMLLASLILHWILKATHGDCTLTFAVYLLCAGLYPQSVHLCCMFYYEASGGQRWSLSEVSACRIKLQNAWFSL